MSSKFWELRFTTVGGGRSEGVAKAPEDWSTQQVIENISLGENEGDIQRVLGIIPTEGPNFLWDMTAQQPNPDA